MGAKEDFYAKWGPIFARQLAGTGIDPRIALAQFAQETGWGQSIKGGNLFNITGKGMVRGDTNAAGQPIQQSFRTYATPEESINDYVKLMKTSPRYAGLLSGTTQERAAALGRSGYAEDPNYGTRIAGLAAGVPEGVLGTSSPLTGTGAPVAAPIVQRARNIDEFRRLMSEKFPGLRYTSGYRSPSANKAAGGAKGSQHMHNLAVDVGLKEYDPATQQQIVDYARQIGARGLGYYPNSQSAHFDLRTGAPAAWGQNYSRTSLGGTPDWFQKTAQAHLSGAPTTALASSGAIGGAPGGAGGGGGQSPSQPTAAPAPAPLTPQQNIFGGLAKMAQSLQPAPIEPAHPMQEAPSAEAPSGPEPGGAASLMAQLIDRKREQYMPTPQTQPGIFETGVWG